MLHPLPLPPCKDLQRLFPDEREVVRITLVEAQDILSSFDDGLRSYTEDLIRRREAMQIVKASVTEVTPTHVRFNDGSKLACGMVVWSTGLAPRWVCLCVRVYTRTGMHRSIVVLFLREFTKSLALEKTPQGRVGVAVGVAIVL